MKGNKQKVIQGRRDFIRGGAIAGASVVMAGSVPSVALSATEEAARDEQPKEEGYRLTKHILDYYRTAAR